MSNSLTLDKLKGINAGMSNEQLVVTLDLFCNALAVFLQIGHGVCLHIPVIPSDPNEEKTISKFIVHREELGMAVSETDVDIPHGQIVVMDFNISGSSDQLH